MKNRKLFYTLLLAAVVLFLAMWACGSTAPETPTGPTPTTGPSPTPTLRPYLPPPDKGVTYSIPQISTDALATAQKVIGDNMTTTAWTIGFAIFFAIIAIGIWIVPGWWVTLLIVLSIAIGGFGSNYFVGSKISSTQYTLGHQESDKSVNAGVAYAQSAEATNMQYFHANISQIGEVRVPCQSGDHESRDFCGQNSHYYNHWTTQECSGSGKDRTCWDIDHYENWFTYLTRHYIVVDTKARYLSEQAYHQQCLADDNHSIMDCPRGTDGTINNTKDAHKPVIFLDADWRAPSDAETNRQSTWLGKVDAGQYNNHIPDAWTAVKNSGVTCSNGTCGYVYDATFVGPYFNYGFAADSPLFEPYSGHYQDLLKIASLRVADGATFQYTDAFGQPTVLHTQLTSTDDDLPINFNPINIVGSCLSNNNDVKGFADVAMRLQGDFGPHKQGSARWFFVCKSIVDKLGGMPNIVSALKAYERDENVWGLFSMPQNLVIIVEEISDDGTQILARGMETGMHAGNHQVESDMAESIPQGTSLPLNADNAFGKFTANYVPAATDFTTVSNQDGSVDLYAQFSYQYTPLDKDGKTDLSLAGGPVAILYAKDPSYVPPDPSSADCKTAKADYHGFVRYSMCNDQYLQATIQITQQGHDLIMAQTAKDASDATSTTAGWVLMIVAFVLMCFSVAGKSGAFDNLGDS